MSPRHEREAAMDDMAEYAVTHPQARPVNQIDEFCKMTTERLVEEAHGLQARMLAPVHATRDFALVTAMTLRLQRASTAHALVTNREVLEGMLRLDIPDESAVAAPALHFYGADRRHP